MVTVGLEPVPDEIGQKWGGQVASLSQGSYWNCTSMYDGNFRFVKNYHVLVLLDVKCNLTGWVETLR